MASVHEEARLKIIEDEESSKRRLKEMWEKKELTDVVLVCDGGEVEAHRLILSIRSPYFQRMFLNDFKESSTSRVDFSYVKKDIMVLILHYIYLYEVRILEDENVENLIQIYQLSHLFEFEGLSKYYWSLILKNLNTDYWFQIWELVLLHGNVEDVCKILGFILENLSETVGKIISTLSYSQIMNLIEKINANNFPFEEDFLEIIVEWNRKTNQPKGHLQNIFLKIKFDFISKEFFSDILDKEKDSFEDPLFKQFFESQFLPKLKTKSQVHFRLKLFLFRWKGKSLPPEDRLENGRLEMFDCETKSSLKVIENLPFRCHGSMTPIQCGSDIYMIGCLSTGCPVDSRQSFFMYDWKKNEVVMKPFLPEEVISPLTCSNKNDIYVMERDVEMHYDFTIQNFSVVEQKWFVKKYTEYNLYPIACVCVKSVIYLFFDRSNDKERSDLVLFTVNQKLEYTFHSKTPISVGSRLDRYHFGVYEDTVVVLIKNHDNYVCNTFDPDTQLWKDWRNSIPSDFYFIDNKFPMFYSEERHAIYRFYANNSYIKKIMTVDRSRDEDHVKKHGDVNERVFVFH